MANYIAGCVIVLFAEICFFSIFFSHYFEQNDFTNAMIKAMTLSGLVGLGIGIARGFQIGLLGCDFLAVEAMVIRESAKIFLVIFLEFMLIMLYLTKKKS